MKAYGILLALEQSSIMSDELLKQRFALGRLRACFRRGAVLRTYDMRASHRSGDGSAPVAEIQFGT